MEATLNISRWIACPKFFYFIYLGIIIYNLDWVVDCDIYIYIYEVMSHDQQFLSPFRLVRVIFTLIIINSITLLLGLLISCTLFLSLSLCDTLQRKITKKNLSGTV